MIAIVNNIKFRSKTDDYISNLPIIVAMKKIEQKQNKRRGASQAGSSNKLPPVHSKHSLPQNLSMNSVSQQEEGLVSILHEYFMKNNFMDTLDTFQKECCKPTKTSVKNQEAMKKELLTLFDQGSRDMFFSKFSQFVPLSMRTKDPQTMKMQFYIQLYFFVYNIHPALGKKRLPDGQAKQYFSAYLKGRGATLSKDAQFLQYYALTNLQKPQDHPTFKPIFTREWVSELRKRVAYFFEKLYPTGKTPALVVMYDKFIELLEKQSQMTFGDHDDEPMQIQEEIVEEDQNILSPHPIVHNSRGYEKNGPDINNSNAKINQITFKNDQQQIQGLNLRIEQLQEQKDNLFHHLENQKKKSQHWQNTYQQFSEAAQSTLMESQTKWFQITQQIYNITDEILGTCKKLQAGVELPDPGIVDRTAEKLAKYQKFIKINWQQVISSNEPIDMSVFNGADDNSVDMTRKKQVQLDFQKIHDVLNHPEIKDGGQEANKAIWQSKILLLQAMRWRIDRPRSILAKRQAVLSYTMYDILGLKQEGDKTLEVLINSGRQDVVLETIGFICALTKDYYGRQYIVCQKLYKPCVELLTSNRIGDNGKKQLILSFQWSSIKKLAQQLLIKYEMIKIIVEVLQNKSDVINPQFLQFCVALLVNILLHKDGPKKAEEIKQDIMRALINLIESDIINVRSFVHASLYPLLSHKSFRQTAKRFGLLENIKFLLQNKDSIEHNHQLIYLKEKLQKDEDDQKAEEEEEDYEEQPQEVEQDNDLDEFFGAQYREDCDDQHTELNINGIKGQELLMKEYFMIGPEALEQMKKIEEAVSGSLKRKSIMMDKSFYDRQSVSTPLLNNKIRRNVSNNNSVYSNKSSNRVLKSEMNSRSLVNAVQVTKGREKIDNVQQNNSEVSMKGKEPLQNLESLQPLQVEPSSALEQTFRGHEDRPVVNGQSIIQREPRPYQKSDEYKNAFQTRSKLVRTPPRK